MAKQHDDEAPDSGAKASSFGPGTVLRGIRRHSIISFLFFLATVGAAAAVYIFLPLPKMTAYSVIQISSQPPKFDETLGQPSPQFNVFRQTQAALIVSRDNLIRALRPTIAKSNGEGATTNGKASNQDKPKDDGKLANDDAAGQEKQKNDDKANASSTSKNAVEPKAGSASNPRSLVQNAFLRSIPANQQIEWLQSKLKVDFRSSPELMRISLEGDEGGAMTELIKAIVNAYMESTRDDDRAKIKALEEQLDALTKKRDEKKKAAELDPWPGSQNFGSNRNIDPAQLWIEKQKVDAEIRRTESEQLSLREKLDALSYSLFGRPMAKSNQNSKSATAATAKPSHASKNVTVATAKPSQNSDKAATDKPGQGFRSVSIAMAKVVVTADEPVPEAAIDAALKNDGDYKEILGRRTTIEAIVNEMKKTLSPNVLSSEDKKPDSLRSREKQLAEIESELRGYVITARNRIRRQILEMEMNDVRKSLTRVEDQLRMLRLWQNRPDIRNAKQPPSNLEANVGRLGLDSDLATIPQLEDAIDRLNKQIKSIKNAIQNTDDRNSSVRMKVREPAIAVEGIEGNRRLKYTLMAAGAVLCLGLASVTFLEVRNRRVVSPVEISDGLGIKLIGTVPTISRRALSSEVQDRKSAMLQSMVAESVDSARVMLVHGLDPTKSVRTLLVTSALPGEGKTMLACNLASSLARAGFKTLLIDGDLRRPSLHHLFEARETPGLCELLRDEADPLVAVQPGIVPNLSFLPAGAWDDDVRQPLASNKWQTLKSQLESGFEYVVIDSSPLLLVTDPLLVARDTDGVVISVLRDVSQVGAVAEARDRLKSLGIKVLGVVVNGFDNPTYRSAIPYYKASQSGSNASIEVKSESEINI